MKKIFGIALCAAIIVGTASVSAQARGQRQQQQPQQQTQQQTQQQRTPEEMAKQRADRMKEQLSLTGAQYEKVLALEKERAAQMNQSGARTREDWTKMTDEQRTQMREKMREAQEAHNAKLKKILTEEQFTKYREMNQNGPRENRPDAGNRRQSGGERPAPEAQ